MIRLTKTLLPVLASLILVGLTSAGLPSVAKANGSSGVTGQTAKIYVFALYYRSNGQWHYYQQYFVTQYANGSWDYGGLDVGARNLRAAGYSGNDLYFKYKVKEWRTTNNG